MVKLSLKSNLWGAHEPSGLFGAGYVGASLVAFEKVLGIMTSADIKCKL